MKMKFSSKEWRPYFAWHPIEVGNRLREGTRWVWLEWLERKVLETFEGAHAWSSWVYRFPVIHPESDNAYRNRLFELCPNLRSEHEISVATGTALDAIGAEYNIPRKGIQND